MKLALLMLGLLVVGTVCVFGLPILGIRPNDYEGCYAMVFLTVVYGSGGLLGTWVALGVGSTLWRMVGIIVGITVCVALDSMAGSKLALDVWTISVGVRLGVVALPLLIARAVGVELQQLGHDPCLGFPSKGVGRQQSDFVYDDAAGARTQWSLWSLLSWTAGIAVLLSCLTTWRIVASPDVTDAYLGWDEVKNSVAFILVPPAALLGAVGTRWFAARIGLLALTIASTAIGLTHRFAFLGSDPCALAVVVLVPTAWLTGSFLVVRIAGYRLVWRRSITL